MAGHHWLNVASRELGARLLRRHGQRSVDRVSALLSTHGYDPEHKSESALANSVEQKIEKRRRIARARHVVPLDEPPHWIEQPRDKCHRQKPLQKSHARLWNHGVRARSQSEPAEHEH
eukprot:Amastigsp_a676819_361.p2 type:complete len:118 gc:universal Amastigsp_a676819_361:284-637(+)